MTGLRESEQPQDRQQQSAAEKNRRHPAIPRPQPQPKMKADAAVQPSDGDESRLLQSIPRLGMPQGQNQQRVGIVDAKPFMLHPRADEMKRKQRRDRQAERQLQRFPQAGCADGGADKATREPAKNA